ncbi:bifunctional proline dehydrogenase/L-glutamate gamma-semialdehyde dehydrogenase PutA [Psychrobium sp. MM17-31]|uniref:bifunctional proline dehydrogenase/L-glutamate gamma-semialdehyde dehydrogenase PutA n=1 Tax=Psychrobium sp. MM17-31 TaxID=2917758 RepID=UPI001EF48F67|nr:bifunctional proline dehydrogenase/L-glutamate gamma-semialdehyde dehydrogenase PutA [Psychrobium sp. MM17-31]MCG7531628.1 bifunctional proline dehydrogenase/L-glutamate gamma-semialdehyde dehydrogenase PutA [Psychrobium sp. MM17-31]
MLFNESLTATNPIRQTIRDHYRCDENEILDHLLPLAKIDVDAKSRAWEHARQMVVNIRKDQIGKGGVDALLNEFALSTEEGVVLMCLAEALLRVPDKVTADNLIRDKLANGDWSSHIGNSDSIFVNASSWGLLMTGKLVNYTDKDKKEQFNVLKRTVGRLGEPVIRKAVRYAMKIMGTQFVMGRNIGEAVERAVEQEAKGYTYSYDMLGEGARTMADANRYFDAYVGAIHAIGKAANGRGPQPSPGISIKLSAIHPRYEFSHRERVIEELTPRLKELAILAKGYNIGFTVDAEEADRLDISMDIIEAVFLDKDLDGWDGFGIAVQAYQKRAIFVIDWVRELTQKAGRQMMVRLVKGAYWDSEVKISQVECLEDFPVFSRKPSTDVSYQACAKKLLSYRDTIYPQFATHNAYTVATILQMAAGDKTGFEFQRLHGMGESLYDQVVQGEKVSCRVYAPVGAHEDLLAYLVRRLLENGANSSFVNNIVDEDIPVESLLADPVETVSAWVNKYNPQIAMPDDLYGDERKNSKGIDLTDVDDVTAMKNNLDAWFANNRISAEDVPAGSAPVTNPANHDEIIGYITHVDEAGMSQLVENAQTAFETWSQTDVKVRADVLRKTADLLEENRDELIALCIKEAGKIPVDGVAEVREAVDFCRYYAARAEELMADERLASRGVVLAISPWNFPLAIFLGQVAAAVVVGNTVVAKPAEQTSLIALRAIELMEQAGLPQNVVLPVIARGSKVGQVIVPDHRIKAVMFTGSTETGTRIAQDLAARGGEPVPLIAETGGQNCMIVDSTALPEQVVDDVIASGFQSAGQRCSALRVLFVQEEIADKVITMITGAMKELHVGDPQFFSSDVGPVIDDKAFSALHSHVDYLSNHPKAKLHYTCELPNMGETGNFFFAPRLYEIDDLSVLTQEVFGPCVHVIRFKGNNIQGVIDEVNSTGFGLTMGIHTRIDQKAKFLASRSRAGNVYINRNMIGAIVGVQPFGGRGLSGTGPKAGGPAYLTRLVKEVNTPQTPRFDDPTIESLNAVFGKSAGPAVNNIVSRSKNAEKSWQHSDVNTRLSVLRQLLAHVSNNSAFSKEDNFEATIANASRLLIDAEKKLIDPITLPGPTGELNELYLESRGVLAHIGDDNTGFEFWFISLIAALAAGNTVIAIGNDEMTAKANVINTGLTKIGIIDGVFQVANQEQLDAVVAHDFVAGAIVDSNTSLMHLVNDKLAARSGAILPLITATHNDNLFMRMVTEKTISTDTTAAGGNASLMTMEIED